MIRRHARIFTHYDEMVYPSEIQYAHPDEYDSYDSDDFGKPKYAFYNSEDEDLDTGEKTGKYTRQNLKIWKYEDHIPIMHNLGPQDAANVLIYEKDLLRDDQGLVYLVDYDKVKCYYYLELPNGERKSVSEVDITTFVIVGNIYQHRKELFINN